MLIKVTLESVKKRKEKQNQLYYQKNKYMYQPWVLIGYKVFVFPFYIVFYIQLNYITICTMMKKCSCNKYICGKIKPQFMGML